MAAALARPKHHRMIAGVCAGIARRFGLAPSLVRFLFLISCLLPGPQVLIYVACWILMPTDEYA